MKLKFSILFCLFAVISLSCNKNGDVAPVKPGYTPGMILIAMRPSTTLTQFFNIMNKLGLYIQDVNTPPYSSSFRPDSLSYITNVLQSKPYLTYGVINYDMVTVQDGSVIAFCYPHDMDFEAQKDWLATIENLKLITNKEFLEAHIKVEPGQELIWIEKLKRTKGISNAWLNYHHNLLWRIE